MIHVVVWVAFALDIAVIAMGLRKGLASFEYLGRGIHEELLRGRARRARPGRTVLLGRVVAEPEGLVERRVVFERHGLRCRWTRYLYFRIGWWRGTSDTVNVAPFWLETIQGMRVRVIPDARTVFYLKCGESKYLGQRHILAARVGVSDSVLVQGELRRGPEPQRADPYRHHEEGSPWELVPSAKRGMCVRHLWGREIGGWGGEHCGTAFSFAAVGFSSAALGFLSWIMTFVLLEPRPYWMPGEKTCLSLFVGGVWVVFAILGAWVVSTFPPVVPWWSLRSHHDLLVKIRRDYQWLTPHEAHRAGPFSAWWPWDRPESERWSGILTSIQMARWESAEKKRKRAKKVRRRRDRERRKNTHTEPAP